MFTQHLAVDFARPRKRKLVEEMDLLRPLVPSEPTLLEKPLEVGTPVDDSQRSAISGGKGAPATATARSEAGGRRGWFSILITLVGTPTITVARARVAMSWQRSGVQWTSPSMTNPAPARRQY